MPLENIIAEYIRKSPIYKAYTKNPDAIYEADGLDFYPLSRASLLMSDKRAGRLFVIVPTEESARSMKEDLSDVSDRPVVYLPSDGKLLYSPYASTKGEYERKVALEQIDEMKRGIVIISLRSFVFPFLSRVALNDNTLVIKKGDSFDIASFSEKLGEAGYVRVPNNCSEEGTFSLRGEVMDIFPFSSEHPVRIYAEWDDIAKISYYDFLSQKTTRSIDKIRIPLLSPGSDKSVSMASISEYLRPDDYFVLSGMERLETSWASIEIESRSLYKEAYRENAGAPLPDKLLFPWKKFSSELCRGFFFYDIASPERYHFSVTASRSYFGNVTYFKDDISALFNAGWSVFVIAQSPVQKERLESVLRDYPVKIEIRDMSSGFQIESENLLVVLDQEIFGRHKKMARMQLETVSSPLDSFVELKEGDYVVHVNYGIGQFVKIERVKTSRTERDYIKIRYSKDEFLYVPIEQANLVQKYIGNDGRIPKLDAIGSSSWTKKKEKAIKNAEELAASLVKLYAERQMIHGYPFSKDNDWQIQFEASFHFSETPDQLKCIDEIKRDMESDRVMDRLVCGDVGYGKTEIAFRAAFKAVMSGKQVAFLAPTVILAEQHYENFKSRLGMFPVKAGIITRFVSSSKVRENLKGIEDGTIDVLFGTHRILGKNMKFKDLGLLIIDEEQRFGVKDKEKIKQLKTNIDCLTLSATPIPRTLYMSLLKVRDMSLLTTAPRERQPIETNIEEFSLPLVVNAIKRELDRGGQVFYLHNRIDDLEDIAMMLRREIPSAIIEAAHGQMNAEELEDKMHRFIFEGVQVLVSTTIIENGIDIPNVNTIIIDRAERLGLAQLYQLRGRVGRSDKKAYCYLLYPDKASLNDDAIKRLRVLSENTGLGAGFKVAMKDMEIRGAGNILGREQSGELEAVGLDMYMKLLEEEIDKLSSDKKKDKREVLLELDYTGFIPDSYVTDPTLKFELYKKISSVSTENELEGLQREVENRFGIIPEEVDNLFCIAEIKIICRKLSIFHLKEVRGVVQLEFSRISDINPDKVVRLVSLSAGKVRLDPRRMSYLEMETSAVSLKDKALFILEQLRRLI